MTGYFSVHSVTFGQFNIDILTASECRNLPKKCKKFFSVIPPNPWVGRGGPLNPAPFSGRLRHVR